MLTSGCGGNPAQPPGPERTQPLPAGFVASPLTVWVDNAFLVIGGSPDVNDSRTPGVKTGSRLDPATGAWAPIAPAPHGLTQADSHVVLGGVLYVVPTAYQELKKGSGDDPTVCESQEFFAYRPATDVWSKLPLPAGQCSIDPAGLVATNDAVVAVSTGVQSSWGSPDTQRLPRFPHAVDAVFSPATSSWTPARTSPPKDVFRWATATPSGLLVVVEPRAPEDGYTQSSPATPEVFSWDYRADVWNRVDRPGSDSLDWAQWTGRIQDASGPVYYQDGNLLVFDPASHTFKKKTPRCGGERCPALNSAATESAGSGASDLGMLTDGWTIGGYGKDGSGYLLRPATGETKKVAVPQSPDPRRDAMDSVATAGGPGMVLSCPVMPRALPKAHYIEDLGGTPAPLTQNGNAGTGQPEAMIRVWVVAAPGLKAMPEELPVKADGTWAYSEGSERNAQAVVQKVEYIHKQDMQAYCYLLRY